MGAEEANDIQSDEIATKLPKSQQLVEKYEISSPGENTRLAFILSTLVVDILHTAPA